MQIKNTIIASNGNSYNAIKNVLLTNPTSELITIL